MLPPFGLTEHVDEPPIAIQFPSHPTYGHLILFHPPPSPPACRGMRPSEQPCGGFVVLPGSVRATLENLFAGLDVPKTVNAESSESIPSQILQWACLGCTLVATLHTWESSFRTQPNRLHVRHEPSHRPRASSPPPVVHILEAHLLLAVTHVPNSQRVAVQRLCASLTTAAPLVSSTRWSCLAFALTLTPRFDVTNGSSVDRYRNHNSPCSSIHFRREFTGEK